MGPQAHRAAPGRRVALFLAIGVHVLLALFLFFGVRWASEHPTPMVAELWSELPKVQPQPAVKPEPPPEPKPEPKPEPEPKPAPRPEPKVQPKAEPKPEPKVDIALEKEKERKRQEALKRQEELERQKVLKEKQEAERRKKEEARKKIEAEKERAERIRREGEAERKRLLAQLGDAVPDQPPAPTSGPIVGKPTPGDPHARAGYVDKIRAKIRSNIILPTDIAGNPEALFDVQQLPTGEVVAVKLRKSSGVQSYDLAVERAIWKSSPLPPPDRRELFEPRLNLTFRPIE